MNRILWKLILREGISPRLSSFDNEREESHQVLPDDQILPPVTVNIVLLDVANVPEPVVGSTLNIEVDRLPIRQVTWCKLFLVFFSDFPICFVLFERICVLLSDYSGKWRSKLILRYRKKAFLLLRQKKTLFSVQIRIRIFSISHLILRILYLSGAQQSRGFYCYR